MALRRKFWMTPHILSLLSCCVLSSCSGVRELRSRGWKPASTMNSIIFSIFQFPTCPAQCFRFAFAGFCFARPPCLDHPLRWEHQVVIFIAVVWTYALAVESPICIGHHHFKVETSGVFYAMPPVEFVVLEDVDHDRAEWSKIPVHFSSASAFVSPRSGSLLVPTWSLRAHLGKTSVSFRCSSCLFSSDSRILISSSSSWAGGEFYAASTSMSCA